jgi:oxalate decarboxylase/phosphoglucose isomerase-like protein (cupin superfamily)
MRVIPSPTLMPNSEEVYIVIEGRGLMLLNGELIEKPVEGSRTYASQLAILYS